MPKKKLSKRDNPRDTLNHLKKMGVIKSPKTKPNESPTTLPPIIKKTKSHLQPILDIFKKQDNQLNNSEKIKDKIVKARQQVDIREITNRTIKGILENYSDTNYDEIKREFDALSTIQREEFWSLITEVIPESMGELVSQKNYLRFIMHFFNAITSSTKLTAKEGIKINNLSISLFNSFEKVTNFTPATLENFSRWIKFQRDFTFLHHQSSDTISHAKIIDILEKALNAIVPTSDSETYKKEIRSVIDRTYKLLFMEYQTNIKQQIPHTKDLREQTERLLNICENKNYPIQGYCPAQFPRGLRRILSNLPEITNEPLPASSTSPTEQFNNTPLITNEHTSTNAIGLVAGGSVITSTIMPVLTQALNTSTSLLENSTLSSNITALTLPTEQPSYTTFITNSDSLILPTAIGIGTLGILTIASLTTYTIWHYLSQKRQPEEHEDSYRKAESVDKLDEERGSLLSVQGSTLTKANNSTQQTNVQLSKSSSESSVSNYRYQYLPSFFSDSNFDEKSNDHNTPQCNYK